MTTIYGNTSRNGETIKASNVIATDGAPCMFHMYVHMYISIHIYSSLGSYLLIRTVITVAGANTILQFLTCVVCVCCVCVCARLCVHISAPTVECSTFLLQLHNFYNVLFIFSVIYMYVRVHIVWSLVTSAIFSLVFVVLVYLFQRLNFCKWTLFPPCTFVDLLFH